MFAASITPNDTVVFVPRTQPGDPSLTADSRSCYSESVGRPGLPADDSWTMPRGGGGGDRLGTSAAAVSQIQLRRTVDAVRHTREGASCLEGRFDVRFIPRAQR